MAVEYKSIEYRLHEILVQIQEMLSLLNFDRELTEAVVECKELIKEKKYNVAVMGEFKRGKSSLINALLGLRILPADSTPTTATINRITYGTTPKTAVHYKDGSSFEISIDELSDYVTKTTTDGAARAVLIKEAVVFFPTVICQNHIDIIDTPGLNDDERMTQITIDMLNNVDAVIMPIHARFPFSETEKNFVCRLMESGGINNIVFAVTFMDQLDEDDYVYEEFIGFIKNRINTEVLKELEIKGADGAVIDKARRLLSDINICGISSSLALKSFVSNNREMLKSSRFEEFNSMLLRTVTSKQLENAVLKTVGVIKKTSGEFENQNIKQLEAFDAEAETIRNTENSFLSYYDNAKKKLDGIFGGCYEEINSIINGLDGCKDLIIREFVKELSALREDSHKAIHRALSIASACAEDIMNSKQKSEINKRISGIFKDASEKFQEYRDSELNGLYDFDGLAFGMNKFVEDILENVCFTWSKSPIPDMNDLTGCNVIETAAAAADASLKSYAEEFNGAVSVIRMNWFSRTKEDCERIKEEYDEFLRKKKEEHDIKSKAYIKNYQTFYGNIKNVLEECEDIKIKFYE